MCQARYAVALPTLISLTPSITPMSQEAVTGKLANKMNESAIPTRPLANTQAQLGIGLIVNEKMIFESPSIMKNTISRSVIVIRPCVGSRRNKKPINTAIIYSLSKPVLLRIGFR